MSYPQKASRELPCGAFTYWVWAQVGKPQLYPQIPFYRLRWKRFLKHISHFQYATKNGNDSKYRRSSGDSAWLICLCSNKRASASTIKSLPQPGTSGGAWMWISPCCFTLLMFGFNVCVVVVATATACCSAPWSGLWRWFASRAFGPSTCASARKPAKEENRGWLFRPGIQEFLLGGGGVVNPPKSYER